MKILKTLLVAGLLASGLAACASDGYGYNHAREPAKIWRDGHRFCLAPDGAYYRCDNQRN